MSKDRKTTNLALKSLDAVGVGDSLWSYPSRFPIGTVTQIQGNTLYCGDQGYKINPNTQVYVLEQNQ